MKAICITIVYLVLTSSFLFAQDTEMLKPKGSIYLNTGKVIKDVRIWTIDSVKIEYEKNGNLCDIKISDVAMIRYNDGNVNDFKKTNLHDVSEKRDTIIINSLIGSVIDKSEKEKYHLLQYYSDSTFVNAVILKNEDSTMTIQVILGNNKIEKRLLRIEEYREISKNIDKWNTIYNNQKKVEISQPVKSKKVPFVFKQNYISINSFDLLLSMLTLNYEYFTKSGKVSVKIPFSFGLVSLSEPSPNTNYFRGNLGYYNNTKTFSTGIELHIFPAGQRRASYFMGPAFEYGQYNYYKPNEPYSYSIFNTLNYTYQQKNGSYNALLFQNGFLFQPNSKFNMSIYISMGFPSYNNELVNGGILDLYGICARTGFNLGFKF